MKIKKDKTYCGSMDIRLIGCSFGIGDKAWLVGKQDNTIKIVEAEIAEIRITKDNIFYTSKFVNEDMFYVFDESFIGSFVFKKYEDALKRMRILKEVPYGTV